MKVPFRGFSAILYKEFLVILRDPLTLFFMLFPPIVEMIAFGYALDTDVKHISSVVFDEDRTTKAANSSINSSTHLGRKLHSWYSRFFTGKRGSPERQLCHPICLTLWQNVQ